MLFWADRFALSIPAGRCEPVTLDGWANFHLPWAAVAITFIALGPGALSFDSRIERLRAGGGRL